MQFGCKGSKKNAHMQVRVLFFLESAFYSTGG